MLKDKIQGEDILGLKLTGPDGEIKDNRLVSNGEEVILTNEFLISREFTSAHEFSGWVQKENAESGVPCMDIVINYCHQRDIDIETISPLINRVLKEKIRLEAEQARLMKPTSRLPI